MMKTRHKAHITWALRLAINSSPIVKNLKSLYFRRYDMKVLKGILKALLSGMIFSLFCGGVYLVGKNTCETVEWGCGKD